jgi:hypothetical protein
MRLKVKEERYFTRGEVDKSMRKAARQRLKKAPSQRDKAYATMGLKALCFLGGGLCAIPYRLPIPENDQELLFSFSLASALGAVAVYSHMAERWLD